MNQKKMLDALTSLRFFAAAMIVLTHGHPLFGSFGIAEAAPLGQGVSFFFVLSGFILTYNYPSFETREQFQNFFVARFARIWPLHAVTCLIWIGLIYKFNREIYFPGAHGVIVLLANLLMVQSWVPLKGWALSFNGVAWSISVEFFFYLCFPFIVILWRRYWHVLLAVSASIIFATLVVGNVLHLPPEDSYQHVGLLGLVYFGPLVRIFEFMIGVGVANLLRSTGPIELSRGKWLLLEVGAILAIVTAMLGVADPVGIRHVFGEAGAYYFQRDGLWLFWALLIGVFAVSTGPIGRLLSTRFFVFLGEISFALYLVHAVIITYLEAYLDRVKAIGLPGFFAFWAVCLTLATLLFLGIERPCRGIILGWWSKHKYGAPARKLHPFGRLELSALGMLIASCVAMSVFRPTTVSTIEASAAQAFLADAKTAKDSSGEFTNGVRVLGVQVKQDGKGGETASVLMKSDRDTKLDSIMAVHLNDASGAIVGTPGDFVLDNAAARVAAGTYWMQSFPVNPAELQKASTFGIVMYNKPPDLLNVSGGKTDWDNRRLIVRVVR